MTEEISRESDPRDDASVDYTSALVAELASSSLAVPAYELLRALGRLDAQPVADLRKLSAELREQGYLRRALETSRLADARMERGRSAATSRLESELSVLTGDLQLDVQAPRAPYVPRDGTVLNVVGNSILDVQSSTTRATAALVGALQETGMRTAQVTQMGVGEAATYESREAGGLTYLRIPGPARGKVPFDEWMNLFTIRLAAVVRKFRPAAIVASSDFVNAMASRAVCVAYDIPLVYDVHGFWHVSWLQRQRAERGWDADDVPGRWGMPDLWSLRRERESASLSDADGVIVRSEALAFDAQALGADGSRLVFIADDEVLPLSVLSMLETLGALETGVTDLVRATARPPESACLREIVGEDRPRLDRIAMMGGGTGETDLIMREGWRDGSLPPVRLDAGFDWIAGCSENRSQAFHLHAWDFMVPFLKAWDETGDRQAFEWALERALSWARTFNDGQSHGTMAWYDMALGLRAARLSYLVQEAVHENVPSSDLMVLSTAVTAHLRALFSPEAFNGRTNHGFYTAVGQLALAKRLSRFPGVGELRAQGERRMGTVVSTQFAADGGHLEHSPDYHRMLLFSFQDAVDEGLLTDPATESLLVKAAEALGWFMQPDGRLVQIGDTPVRAIRKAPGGLAPHTQFLASRGTAGTPNSDEIFVLPESGYAFARSPQPRGTGDHETASYVSLVAAFHSRTHKHCDDLSLTWFDAGRELLVDAGRFGYLDLLPADAPERENGFYYGRPERQYVERTMAHNTLQRNDEEHDRRLRQPYGSGILSGSRNSEGFELSGRVEHGDWDHHRTVLLSPGRALRVRDHVENRDGRNHRFRVWWNLPGDLELDHADEHEARFRLDEARTLVVQSSGSLVTPVRGQTVPLRGWRSEADYEFAPAWSLAFEWTASASFDLESNFRLA